MSAVLSLLGIPEGWLPAASGFAPRVDRLFAALLFASLTVIVVLTALTVTFLLRYRQGTAANRSPVRIATWKIETAWIVGTTAVFMLFFWQGAAIYLDMHSLPLGAREISVVGRQWMWDVRYPDGRREFNELHVQVGAPVRLLMTSEDVIHSFFVPAFRLKEDLVPGRVVSTWFDPIREGTYALYCAQFCGTAHAQMIGQVVVLSPQAYAAWLRGRTAEPVERVVPNALGDVAGQASALGTTRSTVP